MFHSINTRVAVAFLVVAVIVVVAFGGFGFFYIITNQDEVIFKTGASAADSCAAVFELAADELDSGEFVPGNEGYERCRNVLREVCRNNEMVFMYAYRCDVEAGTSTYLMCVADDDDMDERMKRERGYGTVVKTPFTEEELRALQGEIVTEPLELDNSYGHTLAWFSLVNGFDGTVLAGADYSVSEQRQRIGRNIFLVVVPFLVVLAMLLLMQLYILRRYVFNLVREIAGRMRGFKAEHASSFEPFAIDSNDEIGEIARAFEGMVADIDTYMGDIERMTAERVQTDVELDVARRIQLGMVPERSCAAAGGYEVAAFSRAARTVGGDFYDIVERDDGTIAVVVGDVSGKGVAAALFMAMTKTMIAEAFASGTDPAEALNSVNENLMASNPEGMFATVFACVFDPKTGEVRYSNAGHMPPLVVGADVRQLVVDPGDLMGLFDDVCLSEGSITLEKNEGLVIYTDGVTEAVNQDRAFYGNDAFIDHMREGMSYEKAQAIVDTVVDGVDSFTGDCVQSDDLTIAVLVRRMDEGEIDELAGKLELPCEITSLDAIRAAIFETSFDGALKRKACLACEEAFVNIVSYSQAERIWFDVSQRGDTMYVTLEDDGMPFDPLSARKIEKDFEELDSGGMGIPLIFELASEVSYRRAGNRNILALGL